MPWTGTCKTPPRPPSWICPPCRTRSRSPSSSGPSGGSRETRRAIGRPHWILIDEAHYSLHRGGVAADALDLADRGFCFVTYRPSWLRDQVIQAVDIFVLARTTGSEELAFLGSTLPAVVSEGAGLSEALARLPRGEFLLVQRNRERRPSAVTFVAAPRQTVHVRHLTKYVDSCVPPGREFRFRGPDGRVRASADSLHSFRRVVDDRTRRRARPPRRARRLLALGPRRVRATPSWRGSSGRSRRAGAAGSWRTCGGPSTPSSRSATERTTRCLLRRSGRRASGRPWPRPPPRERGLSSPEAAARLQALGPNELAPPRRFEAAPRAAPLLRQPARADPARGQRGLGRRSARWSAR